MCQRAPPLPFRITSACPSDPRTKKKRKKRREREKRKKMTTSKSISRGDMPRGLSSLESGGISDAEEGDGDASPAPPPPPTGEASAREEAAATADGRGVDDDGYENENDPEAPPPQSEEVELRRLDGGVEGSTTSEEKKKEGPAAGGGNAKDVLASSHRLRSNVRGGSEVEQLCERIETRRSNRIPITRTVLDELIKNSREIALERNRDPPWLIHLDDLRELRGRFQEKVDADGPPGFVRITLLWMGFHDAHRKLVDVADRSIEVVQEFQLEEDDWFSVRDFAFYHTRLVSRWPWMRNKVHVSAFTLFLFYLFTPVLFCPIMDDRGVCPEDPTGKNRSWYGWMSALYFASTTMSTVGYGDLSVEKQDRWRVFIGICYMIVSLLVAIQAFSAAVDTAFNPLSLWSQKMWDAFLPNDEKDATLLKRLRKVKAVKITEIVAQFTVLNLIGLFAARCFVRWGVSDGEPEQDSTWMTTLYWAVQTTTTIGYGDLSMPFSLRWFQIIYLMVATYFVGSALGKLASLKQELIDTARFYAWDRQGVSKGMITNMQAYEHDDKVDQYEYALASLIGLGKVTSEDLRPIMDKYRTLAGENGYIELSTMKEEEEGDPVVVETAQ